MRAKAPGQSAFLLVDVIDILNSRHISYAVIGAFAAAFHGVVRASLDADALISLSPASQDIRDLVDELRKAGWEVQYRKGGSSDPVGAVVNVEDHFGNRVDLLMNIRGVTEAVFSRTLKTEFVETTIHMIGLEDFIAMKIFAGSPRDMGDVTAVLKISYDRINRVLLKELVHKYGKEALAKLESFLKESKA